MEIVGLQIELKELEDKNGEIYVLVIGDLGGGTFKLFAQDVTQVKPNSPFSGYVIGEMDALDTYENLQLAFSSIQVSIFQKKKKKKKKKKEKKRRKFDQVFFFFFFFFFLKNEIDQLQDKTHSIIVKGEIVQRATRIFLGGDYDFLCENFDQSNAASSYYCLWCPTDKAHKRDTPWSMDSPAWGEPGNRNSLASLKARSRKKRDPIFRVELDRVVVLPLHIVLGLVAAYLTYLKRDVRFSSV